MQTQGNTRVLGTGSYTPDEVIRSEHLMDEIHAEQKYGLKTTFLNDVLGIDERRMASENQCPSDLAIAAAQNAIHKSGINPTDIDLVIFCGIDRDWQEPSTAHRVQHQIGADKAACFDVTNACHGFMNGLAIADAMIAMGTADTALICTGEITTNVTYHTIKKLKTINNREEAISWIGGLTVGDAGGAMIVQKTDNEQGFKTFNLASSGVHAKLCYYTLNDQGFDGRMHMEEISSSVIQHHEQLVDDTYQALQWQPKEVDYLFCHQVGQRPHKRMIKLSKVSPDIAPITYKHYANITSATIPVLMDLYPPKTGDKVMIMGSGSGLSVSQTGMIM